MKRVNYILSIAACLAALLTSCVKEEAYKLETLNLEVNVTRAGSESEQQGDQIEDVMIWAFLKNPGGTVENKAAGWRTYTPTSDTYTSVTVHIPLPMCNGSADYRLVAIINKGKFGEIVDANGKDLTLNGDTKYNDLINARFESDVVNANLNLDQWGNLSLGNPGTPAVMPVSHWCDVTVKSNNTHTLTDNQYQCAKVDMPVFRAVAKTQLFVARNGNFEVVFPEITIIKADAENQGAVLAEPKAGWSVVDGVDTPDWFTTATLSKDSYNYEFINDPATAPKIEKNDNSFIYTDNSELANTERDGHEVAHYLRGKILYETAESCTTNSTYKAVPTGNGYYYKITYRISTEDTEGDLGQEQTRYVPLPPIVRNHDYQVRALIKEDGGIVVNYTVADWEQVVWNLKFDAAQHTSLLPSPKDTHIESEYYLPTVRYNANSEEGAAVFYFKMTGPEGITWKPTIFANEDDFEVRVYKVTGTDSTTGKPILDSEQTTGDIVAEGSTFYAVKVVAMKPTVATDYESVRLGITHAPQWNEEKPNLLIINPTSNGNFLWPKRSVDTTTTYTEGDEFYVEIYPES